MKMIEKCLDKDGVLYLWQKIKATFAKASHTHTTADVTGLDTALTNANKVTDVKVNGTSVVTNKSANITVDSSLSTTSNNPIKNSTVATKFNSVDSAISGKQDKLIFDVEPTKDSENPVTSDGVKSALDAKQNKLTFDSTPQGDSYNPVYSDGIYTALAYKQDKIENADKLSIDSSGIIAAKNLPSYVDDVMEVLIDSTQQSNGTKWLFDDNNLASFTPETGKIYVIVGRDEDGTVKDAGEYQNTQWRWAGSQYVRLSDGSGISPITNAEIDAIVAQ